ncbi:MAG: D-arabinose 5-phosphate isomerase [Ectothiorhodospiraceae bacterium]|nr:D-arabinose 5-phosphate isomerase [Ectothiorhodospiraceae bacterium]
MISTDTTVDPKIIDYGKATIRVEAQALAALEGRIGNSFAEAVELILRSNGRVVVTGMGKSGLIARKIVATLNSTGTPSLFLHPGDAIHGDLGMVREDDVVIILSKSGDTEEIRQILPILNQIGVPLIAIVGKVESTIAKEARVVLDGSVEEEACPHDLAPTTSTTVALALGDALAVALLKKRGFTAADFALYHPGGILGKRLLLKIKEIMSTEEAVPRVHQSVALKDAIIEMTTKRLGSTCVLDDEGKLIGVITDGDLRRLLERDTDLQNLVAFDVMTKSPKTVQDSTLASHALEMMEAYKITQLIVTNTENEPIGMVHLHDLIQLGLGSK